MKFVLTVLAILSYLVAASLAADDKCKFADFAEGQKMVTGEKQVVEWQCKGNAKTDLVYLEIGMGKTPADYVYVDTIDAKAKASAKKFSFILKNEYQSGDYLARMLTIGANEKLPVEEADRSVLPWTYSPAFEIQNSADSTDNATDSGSDNATDNSDSSSPISNSNSSTNGNSPNSQDSGNAADVLSIVGSPLLFCAGVLAGFLVL